MTAVIRILALLAAGSGAFLLLFAGFQVMAGVGGQEADALFAWIGLGSLSGLFLISNALAFRCLGLAVGDSLLKISIGLNGLQGLLSVGFLGLTIAYGEVVHAYYLAIPIWNAVIIWVCWRKRSGRIASQ